MLRLISRFFSLMFITWIFFGLTHVFALEWWSKPCWTPTPNCPCRSDPSWTYSSNSSWWTRRVSAWTWFINGYNFNWGYSSDSSDKVQADRFINRYWLSYSNPRAIQQKINKLAEVFPAKCSAACEDGRLWNETISRMASCLCADADSKPANFGGDCPQWFTWDWNWCCIAIFPTWTGDGGTWWINTWTTTTWTNNTCTWTWEIWVQSWTSRTCKPCPDPTKQKPNDAHTKCICDASKWCCGIQLNTVVPFIGDCIEMSNEESSNNTTRVTALNAFPKLMWWLSKIIVTAILIFSFVMVVAWWVLITAWWLKQENYKTWIDIITKVIVALALLWASWIILRLINPNFFG